VTPIMTKRDSPHSGIDIPSIVRRLSIIAVPLLLYFSLLGRSKLFNDADTFWHIAVGRTTLETGLITADRFSFTRSGERWVANQWLAECILAVADAWAGLDGVFVLTVTVLTATYLALANRWLVQGFDSLLTLTFILLIVSVSAYTLNARPHIASIGLMGWVYVQLRDVEDGRKRLGQLFWLIPLFVVWSNLHGGVLGGFGTLVLAAAGWTALWFIGAATPISSGRDVGVLCVAAAGCGLALLATPYGLGSLEAWLTIMSMSLPDLIIEHAPLDPNSPQGVFVILLAIFYVAIFAATRRAWAQPTFWLPLVWYVLTCQRIRHAPLFAMVVGVATADLLPRSLMASWLVRRRWLKTNPETFDRTDNSDLQAPRDIGASATRRRPAVAAVCIALVVIFVATPLCGAVVWLRHAGPLPLIGVAWSHPPARVFPEGLVAPLTEFAKDHRDGTAVFNEPILGGFLINNFPTLRVFIDGRCELYGEPFLRDFVAAWEDPIRVASWQKQFGFRAALIESNSPLRTYFDNDYRWDLVALAPSARFYRMK
jgi:hypothetical protein